MPGLLRKSLYYLQEGSVFSCGATEMLVLQALLVLFLVLVPCRGDFPVGSKLRVGERWLSPNGTFAVGFLESNNVNSGAAYHLSVWYNVEAAQEANVVWTLVADSKQPISVGEDAWLVLQSDALVIAGSRGSEHRIAECDSSCTGASLMENGNFVVRGRKSWQSFHAPTDTLVPEQQLTGELTSGKYTLSMILNQVTLRYADYSIFSYWQMKKETVEACLDDNGGTKYDPTCLSAPATCCQRDPSLTKQPLLNMTTDGVLTFYAADGEPWYYAPDNSSTRYSLDYGTSKPRMLRLGKDGNLRMLSFSSSGAWNVVWQALPRECDVFGACGPFGICTYRPTKTCSCPPHFHPLDQNDVSQGCTYDVPLECGDGTSTAFVEMNRADFFYNDVHFDAVPKSLETCTAHCRENCNCLVAAYKHDGSGLCFLKEGFQGKMYNGQQSPGQNNLVFLKVAGRVAGSKIRNASTATADPFVATDVNSTNIGRYTFLKQGSYFSRHLQVFLVTAAIAQVVIYVFIGVYTWWKVHGRLGRMWNQYDKAAAVQGAPIRLSYQELVIATNSFTHLIGSGGFGKVFKGVLPGNVLVAVKSLQVATEGQKQFKAEVRTIGRVRHMNLVQLLGYCVEDNHWLLVYEYMPNSSLDKILRPSAGSSCCWRTRYEIALGVARGLAYLHENCEDCILHCDIKPQNVLLDANMCPKVGDFGLAKLMNREHHSAVVTTVRGTRGYMAPEWIKNATITAKVDVYSYGMVLLEVLSGKEKFVCTPSAVKTDPLFGHITSTWLRTFRALLVRTFRRTWTGCSWSGCSRSHFYAYRLIHQTGLQ